MVAIEPSVEYNELDRRLSLNPGLIKASDITGYLAPISCHPAYARMKDVKKISMLHVDTLMLLRLFALGAKGGILEIGPYIGGSTIAIASGARDGSRSRFVSIETGGKYPDHPDYPSDDIIADLRKNVGAAGLSSYVHILEGHSHDVHVRNKVFEILADCGLSFVFIDADGKIDRDMNTYRSLFNENCILAFDDYIAPGNQKQSNVQSAVAQEVASGRLETLGVVPWGTWFGRYHVL